MLKGQELAEEDGRRLLRPHQRELVQDERMPDQVQRRKSRVSHRTKTK